MSQRAVGILQEYDLRLLVIYMDRKYKTACLLPIICKNNFRITGLTVKGIISNILEDGV